MSDLTPVPNKGFHCLPNSVDDELNVYQYRLLGHYKRVCGESVDGACWESAATTAERTKMSVRKVKSTRAELQCLGYINLEARSGDTSRVTMPDTMRVTSTHAPEAQPHAPAAPPHAPDAQGDAPEARGYAPAAPLPVHEVHPKNNSFKNNQEEEPIEKGGEDARARGGLALINAYISAFPPNARPVGVKNNLPIQRQAAELAAEGYTSDDVTALVESKLAEGKTRYPFAWLVEDLPGWRLEAGDSPPDDALFVAPSDDEPLADLAADGEPVISDDKKAMVAEMFAALERKQRATDPDKRAAAIFAEVQQRLGVNCVTA